MIVRLTKGAARIFRDLPKFMRWVSELCIGRRLRCLQPVAGADVAELGDQFLGSGASTDRSSSLTQPS